MNILLDHVDWGRELATAFQENQLNKLLSYADWGEQPPNASETAIQMKPS